MTGFEASALFLLAALLICGVFAAALRQALPLARRLRAALADCPETLELRYTIRETVVGWNDGTVVVLPLRARSIPRARPVGLRAAA